MRRPVGPRWRRREHEHLPRAEYASAGRRVAVPIDDHPQRLPRYIDFTHGKLRIVLPHRADAGKDGARAGAPAMTIGTRGRPGDPLTGSVVERGAPIQARRYLHAHPRAARLD